MCARDRRVVIALALIGSLLQAETFAQVRRGTLEAPNEVDPGVLAATLFENADVWVSHVRVKPGSARRVHQHDDTAYDVIIATEAGLQLTVRDDVKELRPWEAVQMPTGTPHAFRNVGGTTLTVIELHMKRSNAR